MPSLPTLPKRNQQNTDEDSISSLSDSDKSHHDAQVSSNSVPAPPARVRENDLVAALDMDR